MSRRTTVRNILLKHPLLFFFSLVYLISWACWLPMMSRGSQVLLVAGSFSPTFTALFLTGFLEGKRGVVCLMKRLLDWRVHIGWYLFSMFSTSLVVLSAVFLHIRLGGAMPKFNDPHQAYLIPIVFLYVLFFSVLGEEIGWRGFALPRLLRQYNPLFSSLILGILWGIWHLPLFWAKDNFHQTIPISLFLLQSVAFTFIYTWLYEHTNGSLLIAHLFHAASNTTLGILPILPLDNQGDTRPLWLAVGLLIVFTLFVVGYDSKRWINRSA